LSKNSSNLWLKKITLRLVVLFPPHVTLILETTSLAHVVTHCSNVADEFSSEDVFLPDQNTTDHDDNNARVLELIELVGKTKNNSDKQDEENSELFESHECSQRQHSHTVRTQNVSCAHYYGVRNDHLNCVFSEFRLKHSHKDYDVDDSLHEECLNNRNGYK
jgi:hypothetical protein